MTLKVDLEKQVRLLEEQVAALLQVEAAYTNAVEGLHAHDLTRPEPGSFQGLSYANAVTDWRIGYETIANSILARAGY